MSPPAALNGYSNEHELSAYERMGRDLLQDMQIYEKLLRMDGRPVPSLWPSSLDIKRCYSEAAEAARQKVVELAQQILATTMDPSMNLLISSLQFHFCSCLKVAVDLRIAEHIPKQGQMSLRELAVATGAQEGLLVRIMRVLITKFIFAESKPGFYCHTTMSWAMSGSDQKYLLGHRLDEAFRSSSRQADALRLSGYREPVLSDKYGFNLAFDTDIKFWEYITGAEPMRGENFNRAMKAVNINSLDTIPTLYPFDRLSENGGLIVDVGGGLGQVGRKILAHYPHSDLRCVVQDRFAVIRPIANANGAENIQSPKDLHEITLQNHNFFDPQPIKGAAAYFFRHIFHDWPDSACVNILKQIIPAMNPQHSRILICDQVIRKDSLSASSVLYDIDMMCMFGGKERTLSEWEALISETDERLRIIELWTSPTSPTTILEIKF